MLKDYAMTEKIFLMNITETWLNEEIKEGADIENYNIYRGDRKDRQRGGTAIYLYDKLEAKQLCEKSHKGCEMVAIHIPELNLINIVIYRPPKTRKKDFDVILDEIEKILINMKKPEPSIIMSGDFNFPFVEWKRMTNGGCTWKNKGRSNASQDEKIQFIKLIKICNEYCMLQVVEEPTRGDNTLDLIFTNETSIITNVDVNKTTISDHSKIEITTNFRIIEGQNKRKTNDKDNTMKSLNFRAEEKIDWKRIKECIGRIIWKETLKKGDAIEITVEFLNIISKLSLENIPKKKKEGKDRKIPKEIKKLLNRIKMLKRDKHKAQSKEKKKVIENKIVETEVELLEIKRKKKYKSEKNLPAV